MKKLILLVLVLLAVACVQKPAPVGDVKPVDPANQLAIDIQYVGVPAMTVYANPSADSEKVGEYGLSEAISILERKGEWSMIRMYDGAGWVKSSELISGEEITKLTADTTPRFYIAPAAVPFNAHGEIALQAKVNTDGSVIEVTTIRNTTGSDALAAANGDALKQAKFYPLVDKGARKTFVYEHTVYY